MKKKDFPKEQYDFDALRYATDLRIHYKDGSIVNAQVANYWWTTEDLADVAEVTMDYQSGSRSEELYFPDPEYARVEIIKRKEKENHGSHPEVAYVFPRIDELFSLNNPPCATCETLPAFKHVSFLRGGPKIPDQWGKLKGWDAIDLAPTEDTAKSYPLQCPACKQNFIAHVEWYSFNDTNQPFTWGVTLSRKKETEKA